MTDSYRCFWSLCFSSQRTGMSFVSRGMNSGSPRSLMARRFSVRITNGTTFSLRIDAGGDELVPVEQRHEPLEASGLALVRRGREQQQVRGGFGQRFAQAVAGDLFGAAAEPVGFVADNQIPTGVDQVAEAFLVVRFQLLTGPAPASFDGLDGIDGADDLIELPPDVLGAGEVAPGRELARRQEPELLAEVGLHFLHPLRHEALGGDDQHPKDGEFIDARLFALLC